MLTLFVNIFHLQERDSYWKMMQKYIGSDVTSMVTLPVIIFEPMTMLQKMAEVCAYFCLSLMCMQFWSVLYLFVVIELTLEMMYGNDS